MGIGVGAGVGGALAANPNLLRWTEQFDNPVWVASGVTVTPDAVAPPPDTSRADRLVFAADSQISQLSQTAVATGVGGLSAPAITTGWQRFEKAAVFDGDSYTFSIFMMGAVGGEPVSIGIVRTSGVLQALLFENASVGATIFVSGAQIELGATAGDYFPRTT